MPSRLIRDGILTSERVDALGWAEEVFYRRLQSVVDDYGRFYANPKLLRAACYPLRLDKVSDSDIVKWTALCSEAGLVRVYPASDGKRYLQIVNFGQRIQAKSKFPDPLEPVVNSDPRLETVNSKSGNDEKRLNSTSNDTLKSPVQDPPLPTVENRLVVGGVEDEVVGDRAPRPKSDAQPAEPIFIELPLNDGSEQPITEEQVREFSGLYPAVDVKQSLRGMRAWCVSNPAKRKTKRGVMRFVNSWLAKEQDAPKRHNGAAYTPAMAAGTPRQRRELGV